MTRTKLTTMFQKHARAGDPKAGVFYFHATRRWSCTHSRVWKSNFTFSRQKISSITLNAKSQIPAPMWRFYREPHFHCEHIPILYETWIHVQDHTVFIIIWRMLVVLKCSCIRPNGPTTVPPRSYYGPTWIPLWSHLGPTLVQPGSHFGPTWVPPGSQ